MSVINCWSIASVVAQRGSLATALLFSPFELFLNPLHKFLIVLVLQDLKKLGV
jgi:hypothetical protein